MKTAPIRASVLIHTDDMETRDFAPISKAGQRIDPSRHFGVIPLRGVSY
jgi:hypothetical protein